MLSMLEKWANDIGEIREKNPDIPRDLQTPEPRKATSLPCADPKDPKPHVASVLHRCLACCQLGSRSLEPSLAQGSLIFELTSMEPSAGKQILELCSAQTAALNTLSI